MFLSLKTTDFDPLNTIQLQKTCHSVFVCFSQLLRVLCLSGSHSTDKFLSTSLNQMGKARCQQHYNFKSAQLGV